MTQIDYIEILANDLGYSIAVRNDAINSIISKRLLPIKHLDELSIFEKSQVIDEFKRRKNSKSLLAGE